MINLNNLHDLRIENFKVFRSSKNVIFLKALEPTLKIDFKVSWSCKI